MVETKIIAFNPIFFPKEKGHYFSVWWWKHQTSDNYRSHGAWENSSVNTSHEEPKYRAKGLFILDALALYKVGRGIQIWNPIIYAVYWGTKIAPDVSKIAKEEGENILELIIRL